jgi:hypothetical protein
VEQLWNWSGKLKMGHKIFTDNYFTALKLFSDLHHSKINACGTVHHNRKVTLSNFRAKYLQLNGGDSPQHGEI